MNRELTPLEALEKIENYCFPQEDASYYYELFSIIKIALKSPIIQDTHYVHIKYDMFSDMQKKTKVLDTIKEKVQFEFLEEQEEGKTIQRYFVIGNRMFPVNQEEFETLKEVLKHESK